MEAIEKAGEINALTERLSWLQADIERIERLLKSYRPINLDLTLGEIREHVTREVLGLKESLLAGADANGFARAKAALAKHLGKLVLTPGLRDGRPVYVVSGNITIPDSEGRRMQMVARDGIAQHYTFFETPLNGILLDPRLDLKEAHGL